MKLFDLFKRKPKYKEFLIDDYILKQKPYCYGELFKALGMDILVRGLCIEGKYHYANIRANRSTIDSIDKMLTENLIKTKNKYSKLYRPKALESMSAFDRLMYAPKEDAVVKDNVIRVLLPNHSEYKQPLKD